MGTSRYNNTKIINNATEQYSEMLSKRGITSITQFSFDKFKEIKIKDVPGLQFQYHTWATGDRFYKLAHQFYGDPTYWWVIAFWNFTPLETDVKLGQIVKIPLPVEKVLNALELGGY